MSRMLRIGLCSCDCGPVTKTTSPADGSSFTYNEGDGVKDTIVMDGPLSEVYTKALNVFFAKKPINNETHDSLSAAFESAAIDAAIEDSINVAYKLDEEALPTISGFKVVSANSDIEETPTAIIYTTSANRDNIDKELQVIETNQDRCKRSGKDFIVFVGPEFGINGKVIQKTDWIDSDQFSKINAFNIGQPFKMATEEFFTARDIPVAVGFENLLEWLKTRSKG